MFLAPCCTVLLNQPMFFRHREKVNFFSDMLFQSKNEQMTNLRDKKKFERTVFTEAGLHHKQQVSFPLLFPRHNISIRDYKSTLHYVTYEILVAAH